MSFIPSIDVHFTQLRTATETFRELTTQLKVLATEGFENQINELRLSWEEEGMNLFTRKLQDVGGELQSEADAMSGVVDEIEKEALLLFDAELYSRGLAFSRWY